MQSNLLHRRSIFGKLSTVDYFRNDNAFGFTAYKTKEEYRNIYDADNTFINSGKLSTKLSTPHTVNYFDRENIYTSAINGFGITGGFTAYKNNKINTEYAGIVSSIFSNPRAVFSNSGIIPTSVDFFSGTKGVWGKNMHPVGFTVNQTDTKFIDIKKGLEYESLTLSPLSYSIEKNNLKFNLKSQLGTQGSPIFKNTGFYYSSPYTKEKIFGEISLNANHLSNIFSSFESSNYTNITSVYNRSVFNVIYNGIYNTYSSDRENFEKKLSKQGDIGIIPFLLFKDGSNLDSYYLKAVNASYQLSFYNNPSNVTSPFGNHVQEPYVITPIGKSGLFGDIDNNLEKNNTFFRSSISNLLKRTASDVYRIGSFFQSSRGVQFLIKQAGLQAMSPMKETEMGVFGSFMIPVNILGQVAVNAFGGHIARHKVFPGESIPEYYNNTMSNSNNDDKNRLRYFLKTLMYSVDDTINLPLITDETAGVSNNVHSIYGINPFGSGHRRSEDSRKVFYTDKESRFNVSSESISNYDTDTPIKNLFSSTSDNPKSKYKYKTYMGMIGDSFTTDVTSGNRYSLPTNNDQEYIYSGSTKLNAINFFKGDLLLLKTRNTIEDQYYSSSDRNKKLKDLNKTPYEYTDDNITLIFKMVTTQRKLEFSAIVDTFTTQLSPNYNSIIYAGNPINYSVYQNTKRSITLAFKVPIYTDSEGMTDKVVQKLKELESYCWPDILSTSTNITNGTPPNDLLYGKIVTPYIEFTYGQVIYKEVGVITGLTYSIDNVTPWDIYKKIPHIVSVTVNMDMLPKMEEIYDYNARSAATNNSAADANVNIKINYPMDDVLWPKTKNKSNFQMDAETHKVYT